MKKPFNKDNKKVICFSILLILAIALFCLFLQGKVEVSFANIENSFFDGSSTMVQVQLDNGDSYKIISKEKRFSGENYLDYSIVNYPVIEFSDQAKYQHIDKKINKILYETSMLNYNDNLVTEINAFYSSNYYITLADQKWICIYFMQSIGSSGSPANFEDAVTISLETGERISLEEFGDADNIMNKLKNYKGTMYLDDMYFSKEDWKDHKKEFIEDWKEEQDRCYYGYYLFEGRLGILFDYYRTGRVRIAFEFEDIIDY